MGGGGKFVPRQFFATAQKRLGLDCWNFVAFIVSLLHKYLVYFLVTWDLTCCHGNLILNMRLAKKRPSLIFLFVENNKEN